MKIFEKIKIKESIPEEFQDLFNREILESERLKTIIFSFAAIALLTSQLIILFFYYEKIYSVFETLTPFLLIMGFTILILLRETQIRRIISKRIKEKLSFDKRFQYINIAIEATIPSVILIGMLLFNFNYEILSSPVLLVYFIVIILSVLGLDFKVTMLAGLVAGIEYLIISVIVLNWSDVPDNVQILSLTFIYLIKSMILTVCGFVGGVVGHMIKRRILKSFRLTSEKNNLVNMLGQQVSRDIAQELIDNNRDLTAKKLFAAVLFLDIRGFTPLVSKLKPEEIIDFQNKIFGFMIDHITKNHGLINQFLGDGYMATFGAPVSRGNVCQNAVNAALGIIKELKEINKRGEIPDTRIGIGIHAGDIVAGNVGTDIRKQYSVSGNTVIISARIEQLTKEYETQLLISKEVFENLEENADEFVSLGEVKVKGRDEPIEILKQK